MSLHLPVPFYLPVCLSVCLSACQSAYLSVWISSCSFSHICLPSDPPPSSLSHWHFSSVIIPHLFLSFSLFLTLYFCLFSCHSFRLSLSVARWLSVSLSLSSQYSLHSPLSIHFHLIASFLPSIPCCISLSLSISFSASSLHPLISRWLPVYLANLFSPTRSSWHFDPWLSLFLSLFARYSFFFPLYYCLIYLLSKWAHVLFYFCSAKSYLSVLSILLNCTPLDGM